jgi:predicted O-methyltransferase YrrM
LTQADQAVAHKVEAIRQSVANGGAVYHPVSSGLDIARTSAQTAFVSSVTPEWGIFLYLCAKSFGAQTILELGASAGISGAYLASAPNCRAFTTLEGSPELAKLARKSISQVAGNFTVIDGFFDDVLDETLSGIGEPLDLVYVDGPKEFESTIACLQKITPSLKQGSLIIFDDIHWSQEMWQMWQAIGRMRGVAHAGNSGRFGLALWHGGSILPRKADFSLLAGWLRVGKGYN